MTAQPKPDPKVLGVLKFYWDKDNHERLPSDLKAAYTFLLPMASYGDDLSNYDAWDRLVHMAKAINAQKDLAEQANLVSIAISAETAWRQAAASLSCQATRSSSAESALYKLNHAARFEKMAAKAEAERLAAETKIEEIYFRLSNHLKLANDG